ncbi:MAG: hypothetical protein WEC73_05625 [Chthoniobacterales bacterium]
MTATRPRLRGKRAFLALLLAAAVLRAEEAPDPGWRLTVIPSFERPTLHENIPGANTAIVAPARNAGYDEMEYATTRAAWRYARDLAEAQGERWLAAADVQIRRDPHRVIDRILITGDDPLLPALAVTPAFHDRFEPLLGAGFHVIIPHRNLIALYPRVGGTIPPREAASLLEMNRYAGYPVSREVFRAFRGGLTGDGILED